VFTNFDLTPFGGIPLPSRVAAAIIPVPVESTVSYGYGTALGPAAIMQASSAMELYDELLDEEPINRGIMTRPAVKNSGSMREVLDRVQAAVDAELRASHLPVVLGGEHTVTLGALEAMVEHHGTGFTVCVLDAHLDLRDQYEGEPLSHACVMRRALDLGLKVKHVGSRSLSKEEADFIKENGINPMWARWIYQSPNWVEEYMQDLEGPIYISLDVDGLDPACLPATGTPEPGGLSWEQVSDWLLAITNDHAVLGMDLVELAPSAGHAAWDFAAARLLYRAMGLALRSHE
jgi:agmatinase